ncbi:MAG: hypothetical protein K2H87_07575 [Duncaniella sp.]|nr:hypothetical protein [Duncaniella sp.]
MKLRNLALAALASLSLICANPISAEITRGQKTFGVSTGYVTLNHSATAGLRFTYAFSRHFVLAPSVDYVFRNQNLDGLLINIDYHGPWQLAASDRWYVYHIIGVNYGSWSAHNTDPTTDDDVTKRKSYPGLDFGAGVAFDVKPTLRLTLQGKFNWLKDHNTGLFNLGISYVF